MKLLSTLLVFVTIANALHEEGNGDTTPQDNTFNNNNQNTNNNNNNFNNNGGTNSNFINGGGSGGNNQARPLTPEEYKFFTDAQWKGLVVEFCG